MKFLSVGDLKTKSSKIWQELPSQKEMVMIYSLTSALIDILRNIHQAKIPGSEAPPSPGFTFNSEKHVFYHEMKQVEDIMETAKLFVNGRSQAVRLPKAYRFEGTEVYIKKIPEGVLLIPKDRSVWDIWEKNLKKYEKPFMNERSQPEVQQERMAG